MLINRIKNRIFNWYYRRMILRKAKVGHGLKVNGKSFVNGNVTLGNNVNFNGMQIRGCGTTIIGDNFHSGTDCVILTSNHNYEGTRIPYDSEMVKREVVIEDNVWIGDHVIILGGGVAGRLHYSSRFRSIRKRDTEMCHRWW